MKRIALVMQLNGLAAEIARGVLEYARPHRDWQLRRISPTDAAWSSLMDWAPHGLLCLTLSPAFKRRILKIGVPAVDICMTSQRRIMPRVGVDDQAVGRLAADHFHKRGYRHHAYVGPPPAQRWYGRLRRTGFIARLTELGYSDAAPTFVRMPPESDWGETDSWYRCTPEPRLLNWLAGLPRPSAIFADSDTFAIWVCEHLRLLGIERPGQIYVLGVDNEVLDCEMVHPPLPSIQLPARAIGLRAAEVLAQLLDGGEAAASDAWLEPVGVIDRDVSSDDCVDDRYVTAALSYIQRHVAEAITVGDVARAAGVSRRFLEIRFRQRLGRTILAEIRAIRIRRAQQLLLETDWPIESVAAASGFVSRVHFSRAFKDVTGRPPGSWRSSIRGNLELDRVAGSPAPSTL